jgi:predicted nuclease of predicted toxin-antitoxin system
MKVLHDHCVPQRLREHFIGHEVFTATEQKWETLRNGDLMAAAANAGFAVMVTVDQNLRYQQNLDALPIAVLVIRSSSNDMDALASVMPLVMSALVELKPCCLVEVGR